MVIVRRLLLVLSFLSGLYGVAMLGVFAEAGTPLERGDQAYRAGDIPIARTLYEEARAGGAPESVIADRLRRCAVVEGNDRMHLIAARSYMASADYRAAATEIDRALGINASDPEILRTAIDIRLALSETRDVRALLDRLRAAGEAGSEDTLRWARYYQKADRFEEARSGALQALAVRSDPADPVSGEARAIAELAKNRIESRERANRARAESRFDQGLAELAAGSASRAARCFAESLDIVSPPRECGPEVEKLSSVHPTTSEYTAAGLLANLAHCLKTMGKPEEAAPLYERAAGLCERGLHCALEAGAVYETGKSPESALEVYERALAKNPESAVLHAAVGRVEQKLGRYEAAIASFRRAATADPRNPVPAYNLAVMLKRSGKTGEAVDAFRSVQKILPAGSRLAFQTEEQLLELGAMP